MAAARGLSWRRHETLDLLAIWGERRIQIALRQSHRNIDLYEEIATEMRSRGHNRTAQECRNKTKALRLEYKKVVGLNAKSGQDRKTCPFYEEIDAILHGDADVWLKRVTQSSDAPEPRSPEEPNAPAPTETTETLLLFTGPTGDETVQVEATDGADVVYLVSEIVDGSLEDSDQTQIEVLLQGEPRSEAAGVHTAEGHVAVMDKGSAGDGIPPGAIMAELSPKSRLALIKARHKKVSAIQRVGETLATQIRKENALMLEAGRAEHQDFMAEMRASREAEMALMQEERAARESNSALVLAAVNCLRDLSNTMVPLAQAIGARYSSLGGTPRRTLLEGSQASPAMGDDDSQNAAPQRTVSSSQQRSRRAAKRKIPYSPPEQ
ncbi:myb/SANT-like DNA-binding domain-containing protein 7 [Heteronotia binoei]|uniref:myb/SANT-like DNA-binding domain-containing protein 7 n=1 Tax=Heteronotia binoei TaxID=13085 RepID=UPI00292E344A|nr:myb/SANT-like DNA-binding domain-containing protein 7 [Heteronotia binoei]